MVSELKRRVEILLRSSDIKDEDQLSIATYNYMKKFKITMNDLKKEPIPSVLIGMKYMKEEEDRRRRKFREKKKRT